MAFHAIDDGVVVGNRSIQVDAQYFPRIVDPVRFLHLIGARRDLGLVLNAEVGELVRSLVTVSSTPGLLPLMQDMTNRG
ncbi:hypothetical protein D3C84_886570 [compost metagenome]